MEEGWVAVAIVAIVFGTIYSIIRTIFGGRAKVEQVSSEAAAHSQKELFDLALRLQSRVDSLERLLDAGQPEWRGKP